ncbi:MAG: PTS sugar transporter subunit IIA [Propionibacterium sp.]
MVGLSERQELLLELLSEMQGPVPAHRLADLLGVSSRTLRYDIARINRATAVPIIEPTQRGHQLNRRAYQTFMARDRSVHTALEDEERVLLFLLDHPDTDVYTLMLECYLGESMVRAVLSQLTVRLDGYDLELSVRGSRISLAGGEFSRRRLLGQMINDALGDSVVDRRRLQRFLPEINFDRVQQVVGTFMRETAPSVDDIEIQNLAINVAICYQRRNHNMIDSAPSMSADSHADTVVPVLLKRLDEAFPGLKLGEVDRNYITSLVRSDLMSTSSKASASDAAQIAPNLEDIAHEAILDTLEHFSLEATSEKLMPSIIEHLGRFVTRSSKFAYFHNNLRESLRSKSPFLYDVAVYLAHRISGALRLRMNDDEIGLLTIYLGLYTKPLEAHGDVSRVVVVCPHYQTLRDWLLSSLLNRFSDRMRILDIVSSVASADLMNCDLLIITTGEVSARHRSVQISAMCSEIDIESIDAALEQERKDRRRGYIGPALARFLDPGLFFADVDFAGSEEAIRFMSGRLVEAGDVPATFTDSVLLRESYSSTAFAHRFAVPHAMEFIAHRTKIAIMIPRSPIDWGSSEVTFVLMLAISESDYDEFELIYQALIHLLYDSTLFSTLRTFREFDDFRSFLEKKLPEGL